MIDDVGIQANTVFLARCEMRDARSSIAKEDHTLQTILVKVEV